MGGYRDFLWPVLLVTAATACFYIFLSHRDGDGTAVDEVVVASWKLYNLEQRARVDATRRQKEQEAIVKSIVNVTEGAKQSKPGGNVFKTRLNLLEHVRREISSMPKRKNTTWSAVADKVVIGIKTGNEVAAERLPWPKSTWLQGVEVPNLIYIADTEIEKLNVSGVEDYEKELLKHRSGLDDRGLFNKTFVGGWRGDKDKNLPALGIMVDRFPDKDYYFLVDDDTYVFLDNLALVLQDKVLKDPRKVPIYGGNIFVLPGGNGDCSIPGWTGKKKFAHGGSGIMMSGKAITMMKENLAECIELFHTCWAGDAQVALCHYHMFDKDPNANLNDFLFEDDVTTTMQRSGYYGKFEREKASKDNEWRTSVKPVTFHKFRSAKEYLDVARLDRLYPGELTLEGLREIFIEWGYEDAKRV